MIIIRGLFNDAFTIETTERRMVRWLINGKDVVGRFRGLIEEPSPYLPEGTEKSRTCQDISCPDLEQSTSQMQFYNVHATIIFSDNATLYR
jgi:hypothetical protein